MILLYRASSLESVYSKGEWEIRDVHFIRLVSFPANSTDSEIIKNLIEQDILKEKCSTYNVFIDDSRKGCLYFFSKDEDMMPFLRLERV